MYRLAGLMGLVESDKSTEYVEFKDSVPRTKKQNLVKVSKMRHLRPVTPLYGIWCGYSYIPIHSAGSVRVLARLIDRVIDIHMHCIHLRFH
jgi:hypothetical protein